MPMYDREIVAAIVEGDPAGLAAAYDQYARGLHAYCRSMLNEPADAADAVQDTFIIASSKVSALRDPERLRSWLFAVARNECHRRLRARASSAPLEEAPDMTDNVRDLGVVAEQEELRALVWAALSGLNPGEREIIELNLRHELDGADLADALGVPRNQAHALASRARAQFETSLGVLLVARSGREYCAELAAILDGWDGELTPLIRKRVNRHIEHCDVCGERKRRELSPAMLLSLLPVAMLPRGLRQQVFHLVSDDSPGSATYRARVAHRAEPFGPEGFPVQVETPSVPRWQGNYALAAVAVIAALALLGGGGVLFADFVSHGGHPAAAGSGATLPASAGPTDLVASPSAAPTATPSASPTPSPRPGGTAPFMTAPIPAVSTSPPAPVPVRPPPRRTTPPPTTATTPPPAPSTVATTPSGGSSSSSAPAPGTLTVPNTVTLYPVVQGNSLAAVGAQWSGTFTMTATGGTVGTYSVSVPAALAADVTVTLSTTAPLLDGDVVIVTVTADAGGLEGSLTVEPGGIPVAISYAAVAASLLPGS
jgi:RNA polymerase sigma factor (sigma-70 family)